MGLFARLSAEYRRGVAAEAAGDLEGAARAFALCGERERAARLHLRRADQTSDRTLRVEALRLAGRLSEPGGRTEAAARRELAGALLERARNGPLGERERSDVREAAALFELDGDPGGAGECWLLLGQQNEAALAFERGGEIERLEALLAKQAASAAQERARRQAFAEYELLSRTGERAAAREALGRFCELSGRRAEDERLLRALDARWPACGCIVLRCAGQTLIACGLASARLGRDPTCELPLRDPGVSRQHAELTWQNDGLQLHDAGSRAGTSIDGARLAGGTTVFLDDGCRLALGEGLELRVALPAPGLALLSVERGLDRSRLLAFTRTALPLALVLPPLSGGIIDLTAGHPRLFPPDGEPILLDGQPLFAPIELLRGDRPRFGSVEIEVL